MSNPDASFIQRCLNGDALLDDIDDAVEQWHTGDTSRSLPEFLGLTEDEYSILVENPDALKAIIYARKSDVPLIEALERIECFSMAARAKSPSEARQILQWLKETKRVS